MSTFARPSGRGPGAVLAVQYTERLKNAFKEVCAHFRDKRTCSHKQLEPLWHFVETLALARCFRVPRQLYDKVDQQVDKMGRLQLIKLALDSFMHSGIAEYMEALRVGSVGPVDAARLYLKLRLTLDWMEDNSYIVDARIPTLETALEELRRVVLRQAVFVGALAEKHSSVRLMWRHMSRQADPAFFPKHAALMT